jgi:hypothetical protein
MLPRTEITCLKQSESSYCGENGQHWSNVQKCFCTPHVNTRYQFFREFIEDGFIKIEFVRSAKDDSALFTKNVNQELYEKHTKKFLEGSEVYSTG